VSAPGSVIVRCRDEVATVEATLQSIRRQSVDVEIVFVDSGSRDGSLEVGRRLCDELVEIPPEEFTYGRALNMGARAASSDFLFALSAHCRYESSDWVERALRHYEREDVAGVTGYHSLPDGTPLTEPFDHDPVHARAHPFWGFSNHASSWRASVWEREPFDEALDYAEDREWAYRVLDAGWTIVIDPELHVDMGHVWRNGLREVFSRNRRAAAAITSFTDLPPYGLRDAAREWWTDMPDERHSKWLYRLDYRRTAGLAGKYAGRR
jgi:rhamnosyltransferase